MLRTQQDRGIFSLPRRTERVLSLFLLLLILLTAYPAHPAHAAYLTLVSDTIGSSAPSANTTHVVAWTSTNSATAGQTIKIQFDPAGDDFNMSSVVVGDISGTGMTVVANIGSCSGTLAEVYPTVDSTAPDEHVLLTVCTGDTVLAGAKTVTIGNNHIGNPATPASYEVTVSGTQPDNGVTRVAIIPSVTMSARVETFLTFSVTGLGVGQTINGATTSTSTTASAIGLGLLVPNTPVVAGQELAVVTNASGGFTVTVRETQNLTSGSADIDTFIDGAETATPVVWAAPSASAGVENTYGHIGLTSDDSDLGGGEFAGQKYAGNFLSAGRAVFSHTGIADGATQDIGKARVAYKIEISGAQEAGDNYTNQLVYVCTPIF